MGRFYLIITLSQPQRAVEKLPVWAVDGGLLRLRRCSQLESIRLNRFVNQIPSVIRHCLHLFLTPDRLVRN